MTLCTHFRDPAEHCQCQQGVRYAALAGGGAFSQITRLPCVPLSNRQGQVVSLCDKYAPQPNGENDDE